LQVPLVSSQNCVEVQVVVDRVEPVLLQDWATLPLHDLEFGVQT
jgi:hypothetical protein